MNDRHSEPDLIDCVPSFGSVDLHMCLLLVKPKAIAEVKALFSHSDSM